MRLSIVKILLGHYTSVQELGSTSMPQEIIESLRRAPVVLEHLKWNAYRSEKLRLVYVATPKVACSSLKWWFAALEGRTRGILQSMDSDETSPELVIHDLFHKIAPDLTCLSLDSLRTALEAADYFRFALVRNPYRRIFSAWQSKLLLREPLQSSPYREFDFIALPIASKSDIRRAFESFLQHLHQFEAPNFWDVHWTPQFQLLRPDLIPYSLVAKLEDVADLDRRLAAHLGRQYISPFAEKHSNESLIPFLPEFVSEVAANLIQQLYATDFVTFDYPIGIPESRTDFSDMQLTTALAAMEMLRGRHRRVTEIRTRLRRDLDGLEREVKRRDAQMLELHASVEHLGREVKRRDAQIAEMCAQLPIMSNDLARVSQENQALRASTSWLVTRPFRWASELLRRSIPKHLLETGQLVTNRAGDFDREFYLKMYPDVTAAKCGPEEHYWQHGKAEGRLGYPPQLDFVGSLALFSKERKTVLVVSHEASLTGAPVLSLNIVQQLTSRYNVVAMLLGGGVISDTFHETGAVVVRASAARGNPVLAEVIIQALSRQVDFKFALVSSIESRWVLPGLAKCGVPTVSLIHEFAAYTRPKGAFLDALLWSTEIVFSTEITFESARAELEHIEDWPPVRILPQGRCTMPMLDLDTQRLSNERARMGRVLRPSGNGNRKFIVLGVGSVQLRKGVDIFIQCAANVLSRIGSDSARFVWIGSGFNPDQDAGYSVYLADQIKRAGLQDMVVFADETPAIEMAYEEADLLLLPSRLDPLPNVAIDAMAHGLPVICFEKTTGIAAILKDAHLGDTCVAKYLDIEDMVHKIIALLESSKLREDLGERLREFASERFDMSRYVAALEDCAMSACERMQQERRDVDDIRCGGKIRMDFAVPPHMLALTPEEFTIHYVRGWASGAMLRKPLPGFHPSIYKARHGLRLAAADPYADYVREGCPAGPWRMAVIDDKMPMPAAAGQTLRVAVHLHAYFPEVVPAFVERLTLNDLHADLFVSVSDEEKRDLVMAQLSSCISRVLDVRVVENRGRDIGPLLTAFGTGLVRDYDIVGHFHTKASKSLDDGSTGQNWNRFILENLLGGQGGKMADRIVGEMAADSSLGLVFPDDPNVIGWSKNRAHAHDLAARLGIEELPDQFNFPVGTMFWARTAILKPFVDLDLDWDDYPEEPLAYDGTMLHAIERLVPTVVQSLGLRCIVTNVEGVSR